MDPKTLRLGRARKPVLKGTPPIFFASVRHAPRNRGPCTQKRNPLGTSLSEVGRAPPRLKNHFGAINFERQSQRAAIASDSAANRPEDVAIGPRAQARPKMFAPDFVGKRAACAPLPRALHLDAQPSRHEPVRSGSRIAAPQKIFRRSKL